MLKPCSGNSKRIGGGPIRPFPDTDFQFSSPLQDANTIGTPPSPVAGRIPIDGEASVSSLELESFGLQN
nr:hypothetical protein Iba_scaffold756072CG0010 [Ipomoea batatas]